MLKILARIELALQHFMRFRVRPRVGEQNFLLLISIWIGILAGFAAVILKKFVHFLRDSLTSNVDFKMHEIALFIAPLMGILLALLFVKIFLKGKIEKGLSRLLYSIVTNNSNLPRQATYSHLITSALTVGFGGSAGLEAPIVITGSAIGATVSRGLQTSRYRNLFLACGAAAGISAVFNSPIAGVIFALEVLLPDLTVAAFIPLMLSSATAMILNKILYTETIFLLTTGGWEVRAIPFYLLLGLGCGWVAFYMIRATLWVERMGAFIRNPFSKWLVGGSIVGAMIYLFPPLFGEGYMSINLLFEGKIAQLTAQNNVLPTHLVSYDLVIWLFFIVLIKVFAAALTVAAGGNGGIFAPSLFTGAFFGFAFARLVNILTGYGLNEANFVAVGMAGVISGVVHAPMTAMFLIAEVTGGYALIVPLMLVSSVSFFMARYLEPHSIYTKPVAEKQQVAINNRDEVLLNRIDINNIVETDFVAVDIDANFRTFLKAVAQSKRNIFPVIKKTPDILGGGHLEGIISLDDVRMVMFDFEKYDNLLVRDFVHDAPTLVRPNDSLKSVLEKFEIHHIWNIPLVDDKGNYIGFISKSKILGAYRDILVQHSTHF